MSVFLFLSSLLENVKGSRDSHNAKVWENSPYHWFIDSFGQTRFASHKHRNSELTVQKLPCLRHRNLLFQNHPWPHVPRCTPQAFPPWGAAAWLRACWEACSTICPKPLFMALLLSILENFSGLRWPPLTPDSVQDILSISFQSLNFSPLKLKFLLDPAPSLMQWAGKLTKHLIREIGKEETQ